MNSFVCIRSIDALYRRRGPGHAAHAILAIHAAGKISKTTYAPALNESPGLGADITPARRRRDFLFDCMTHTYQALA